MSATTKTTWTIGVRSEFAILGHNPENADMENPTGAYCGEIFFLAAENLYGDRRVFGTYPVPEAAEDAIELAPPVHTWDRTYPVYGSEAYQDYGERELVAWEKARG